MAGHERGARSPGTESNRHSQSGRPHRPGPRAHVQSAHRVQEADASRHGNGGVHGLGDWADQQPLQVHRADINGQGIPEV